MGFMTDMHGIIINVGPFQVCTYLLW